MREPHRLLPPRPSLALACGLNLGPCCRFTSGWKCHLCPSKVQPSLAWLQPVGRVWCGAVPEHRWDEHELGQVKTVSRTVLTFQQARKNSKKITCWSENRGWETGTHGPGSSLAPAGGSPGLSSAGWCSPSSCPLLPYVLRHFACGCLSVFLHSRTLSSISRPRALLQPRSAQSRIQIFRASAIWKKAPVLPAALYRLEWKKK